MKSRELKYRDVADNINYFLYDSDFNDLAYIVVVIYKWRDCCEWWDEITHRGIGIKEFNWYD